MEYDWRASPTNDNRSVGRHHYESDNESSSESGSTTGVDHSSEDEYSGYEEQDDWVSNQESDD